MLLPGMARQEQRANFALWAVLKSPLMVGTSLRGLSQTALRILTAEEVLAVSQDKLGVAGDLVWKEGPLEVCLRRRRSAPAAHGRLPACRARGCCAHRALGSALATMFAGRPGRICRQAGCRLQRRLARSGSQVYAGPLEDGARAAVLFNRHVDGSQYPLSNVTVRWDDIGEWRALSRDLPNFNMIGEMCCWMSCRASVRTAGLEEGENAHVRDLFEQRDFGTFSGAYTSAVYVHDVRAVRITPVVPTPQHRWASYDMSWAMPQARACGLQQNKVPNVRCMTGSGGLGSSMAHCMPGCDRLRRG